MVTLERGYKKGSDRHETPNAARDLFSYHILKYAHNHTRRHTLPEVEQPWQMRTKTQKTKDPGDQQKVTSL